MESMPHDRVPDARGEAPRFTRQDVDRWAGLEGWWIMAGILALLVLAFLKAVLLA